MIAYPFPWELLKSRCAAGLTRQGQHLSSALRRNPHFGSRPALSLADTDGRCIELTRAERVHTMRPLIERWTTVALLAHMLPVLSPIIVFLLRLWVGRGSSAPPAAETVKLSLTWSLLSVTIWMLTVQWSQENLVLYCGKVPGRIRPRLFRWERLFAFLVFVFVILNCSMTTDPKCAPLVFSASVGILFATTVYLFVGYCLVGAPSRSES